ncbi:MmgE/PrpD family protein [Phycobacter sp. K97]|uniref:MmgE/PrpD family protein n=1 Tax=Phycobacter sedimenti TaxID=3133977 RepID=UPI00311EE914
MSDGFTKELAAFSCGPVRPSALATEIARLSALDWLSCGRAGAGEPVGHILRNLAKAESGTPQAAVFGGGHAPARMAALVNGTVSHALDYDDTHFAHIGHPSVAIFPAAFAIAHWKDKGLQDCLEAALIGMEVSIRLGLWLGRSHYEVGFHQTATAGAFGATAAAGRLLGLSEAQMAGAFGLAATRAAGLKAQFGTMGKPYNAGIAASAGVEAAQLVAAGFAANATALEGPFGFGAIHHGEGNVREMLNGLGEVWLFETVSHKFHACCHGLHAALEAARELDLAAPEIARLEVKTHPRWISVCNQPEPDSGLGAKFSYRTVLAMQALGIDTARLESYSDAICADPRLVALRARIDVTADDNLSETQATVVLLKKDGERLEVSHDLQQPASLEVREQRVRAKAASLIGRDAAERAWAVLGQGGSVAAFSKLFA